MKHSKKTVFKCGYVNCNEVFDTLPELKAHIKEKHKNDTSKRVFKCGYLNCNKQFNTKQELEKHLLTHNTKNKYKYKGRASKSRFLRKNNKLAIIIIAVLALVLEYYFNLSLIFTITIGIIAFIAALLTLIRIFQWGDRLRMRSDLEIFLARIFSGIFAPVAFIVTLFGSFVLPSLLSYYMLTSFKSASKALIYFTGGADVFLLVYFLTLGFGLAFFSAFMFFRFMRRSGNILWIGRVR